ncbi:MAG TPA: ornithine cyclodeaminase family protein [Anaerolineae bacterium]|jgi:ornithine cyclodeaminase/alanine dehydrogenase-like protein (mu-crystallin family)|nr:ornithine cyclodeaminase family protein [Anaerolineae bacterium]
MIPRDILYLTEDEVAQCMTAKKAVHLAEKGIKADGLGQVAGDKFYMNVGDGGFLKPFSGYLAGEEYAYVKSFSFFEGNQAKGLPVTDSMVFLFDADTGLPACIMEANWITAMKTGASTAVTAKYLSRSDSRVMTIFGAGGLGRTHLLCFNEVFDLDEVRVVDVIPGVAEKFASELANATGLSIVTPDSPEAAVRDSDLIVTVTTGSAVNVEAPWLKPGAFIARMGSYQEVALDLLLKADKLVVDRWAYVSYRVPELVELIQAGKLSADDVYAEWPDIIAGKAAGRESQEEIILYIALGIWGEYAAILPSVYRQAKELGLGARVAG